LLLLVGAVFIYTPGDIAATQVFHFSGLATDPTTWIIYGVIFVYYLVATIFPIDAIIGKIYPVFGAILLFSAIGVFIGMFVKGYPLLNVWDDWQGVALNAFTLAEDGSKVPFSYGEYFNAQHFIPIFFITVACGMLSGFHSTQTAIISRSMKSEKQGRMTFYNMMVLEGFIAMVWAAAAMGVYNLGLQEANAGLATGTVGVVCRDILGNVGGLIALIGIIVLPITSGDTALRGLRLQIAESFHIDQSSKSKRLGLSAVIFALVAVILVFAKMNSNGFNILWRYFAWSNQTLSLFAFLAISVWMFENGKSKFVWVPMIPGAWYTFITITYIMNAKIGFNIPWTISYAIGIVAAVAYVLIICTYGKKRAGRLARK
ncbi:carbon starvation CstA family protein, partial [uncultured Oscillibacter sp.]|uniref:carbon starvation CstA family protein n=1 Tax=uncultured Oscillibacter sp. TaxID=876091 RepID=UPI0025FBFEA4